MFPARASLTLLPVSADVETESEVDTMKTRTITINKSLLVPQIG